MKVEKGDRVSVDYVGTFDDGKEFDSSKHGDHSHPLEFEVGAGQVIKGFDDAVVGMSDGDKKKFRIAKEEAYGERRDDLVKEFPKEGFPEEVREKANVGMMIAVGTPNGQRIPALITAIGENSITIDLNHPMAGKDLNFEIEIVKVVKKSK